MIKTPCLNSETLGKYVLGALDDAEMQDLERHLIECQVCCDHAETLNPSDEVTKAFRAPKASWDADEEIVSDLIQRVAKLHSATTDTGSVQVAERSTWSGDMECGPDVQPTGLLNPPQGPEELGRLGDYRVLEVLGSGGMGFVFLAEDERLRRRVALKVMKSSEARKKGAKERFLREARATAAVEHDNVITIHQVGEDRGIPFIAMPMLQGASLKTILQENERLPQPRAISIGRQIAAGLFAAHQTGLIHRDIKPDNLWIESTKERVKILDFGLVRDLESEEGLTVQGTVLGTPCYMSPEQAAGESVDHRSDLFSLGAVLYQMLSGRSPYAAGTLTATLLNVARAQPTPIESLVPGLDAELIELVARLNARDPKDRPQSADEVVLTLERIGARLASPQQTSPQQVSPQQSSQFADATVAVSQAIQTQPAKKPPKTPWGKYSVAGGAAAAVFLMAITFFVQVGKHNVQITLDDPSISLKIDGEDVLIDDGKVITRLSAGPHKLMVQRDGLSAATDDFTVAKDGKNVIHVSVAEGRIKIAKPNESNSIPTSNVAAASSSGSILPDVRVAEWLRTQELRFHFRLQSRVNANQRWEFFSNSTEQLPTEPYLVEVISLFPPYTDEHRDTTAEKIAPQVQGIRSLVALNIYSDFMTSNGIRKVLELPEFSGVQELHIAGAELDDQIFGAIAKLPNLTNLSLAKVPRLRGEGIGSLNACSKLKSVGWTIATPSAKSLEELALLPSLNDLSLNSIDCTERHISAITKLKLRRLSLLNAEVDDAVARRLSTMTQLESLDINFGKITDQGLQELRSLTALTYLDIRKSPVTATGIAEFQESLPMCKVISQ